MRIQFKDFSKHLFGNLDVGEAFVCYGDLYIKTREALHAGLPVNAVKLDAGSFSFFSANVEIRPFIGKVVEE